MSGSAPLIIITEKQSAVPNEFASSRSDPVSLAQRSKIILWHLAESTMTRLRKLST